MAVSVTFADPHDVAWVVGELLARADNHRIIGNTISARRCTEIADSIGDGLDDLPRSTDTLDDRPWLPAGARVRRVART